MKLTSLEPAYEAARTWAVQPISHPPPGWAQIVRGGVAAWIKTGPPACVGTLSEESRRAPVGVSPLLILVAAMIAEVSR